VERAPRHENFWGFVDRVEAAYAGADLFFFPSYEENQPMAVLETVAMGLPMVLRDIPAYREWLIHDEHCLKANCNEVFIEYIQALASDETLRQRQSQTLRDLSKGHLLGHIGKQYRSLYASLLEGKVYA
jgi:1,2-diacylglycerol-3-alpha-glucose alpha-1,2-glucosyltransferase